MAPRPTQRAILGLALLCSTALASAANPLGSAVAGAPSLFVLAVVESRTDKNETKAVTQEREPRQDKSLQAPDRPGQAAVQAEPQPRTSDNNLADDRKFTLR